METWNAHIAAFIVALPLTLGILALEAAFNLRGTLIGF